jgi:lipopolysaccharide export system permease protein
MLFTRTSASEVVKNIFLVFFILLAIISATQIVRFLGYAAKGQLSNDSVFFLFAFGMLRYSSEILCFSVFLGLVMFLTRLYRDSEMIIWNLYGISQKKFIRVILIITLPFIFFSLVLNIFYKPWINLKTEQYKNQIKASDSISAISPGIFKEFHNGKSVFFVESLSINLDTVKNVFIHTITENGIRITAAKSAKEDLTENGMYLNLSNGRSVEGPLTGKSFDIFQFEEQKILIEQNVRKRQIDDYDTKNINELINDNSSYSKAEIYARLSVPIITVIFVLISFPLCVLGPRSSRGNRIFISSILYMCTVNLIGILQGFIQHSAINFYAGFLPHLVLLFFFINKVMYKKA